MVGVVVPKMHLFQIHLVFHNEASPIGSGAKHLLKCDLSDNNSTGQSLLDTSGKTINGHTTNINHIALQKKVEFEGCNTETDGV